MNCTVTIKRDKSVATAFEGKVVAETTSHYKVVFDKNDTNQEGEWFPKNSKNTYVQLAK